MDKIQLDHVTFLYGEKTPFEMKALDDVSLSIKGGQITGIIGHTGSGKSTMMQLLNGLIKPTAGRVLLDGYDINSRTEDVFAQWKDLPEYRDLSRHRAKKAMAKEIARRRKSLCFRVGLVMQYPEYQLFEETVYKDIAFGPRNMGLSEEEIRERVAEAAAFTQIPTELMEQSPLELSGGQKRRVALAGVIAMRPEVLVLDEPAAGLDPRGRSFILNGIYAYQRATQSTVLIVSHSMEDMALYCDEMVVLSGGKVIRIGGREDVFSDVGELSAIGLDIPQVTQLALLLRKRGVPVPEDLYTVDDAVDAVIRLLTECGTGGETK